MQLATALIKGRIVIWNEVGTRLSVSDGKRIVRAQTSAFMAGRNQWPDEMRLIACGTGMPTARPKQAASCWLLELGNGDKFIFDVGTGSGERIAALQIPYNYLDKVFLSHLHTDHFGDLDALFVGGALAGRQKPLRVRRRYLSERNRSPPLPRFKILTGNL